MGRNLTRWLIPLPAIILAFWPTTVRAEAQPGIQTVYYTIDEIPPIQSDTEYLVCGTEVENNINRNYDYELFEDCTYDMFMVHMTGFIDIPEHDTIELMLATDDGGEMIIDGNTFGNWNDQGCTWMMSGELTLEPGSNAFDVWMYEHGGNSCLMLAWNIDNEGWVIVPDEAFTQQAIAPTTTTSSTTTSSTTSTSTTTTTTTSTSTTTTSSTTTLPPETTTTTEPVQSTTTTSTTSTTTSTTTTVAPAPTTTQAPWTPPQTTTTSEPIVTTTSSTTTTTSLPEPETTTSTTIPETSTTVPETTVPESTVPESTVPESTVPDSTIPETTVPTLPDETTTTSQPQLPETSIPETVPEVVESSSTTTILEIKADQPISDAKVEQILETLTDAKPEQIAAAIEQVLTSNLTSDQAVSIASSPEVLAAITQEQAEQIFEELVVDEITVEQAEELVAVLNEAPTKVKKAFQETINVFAGVFDSFQMVGQTIPVGERRTLVAVSNTLVAVGASLRRKNN